MILPSDEDMKRLKMYAFLPLILAVFERDRKKIESSNIKTKEPYLHLMDWAIRRVEKELVEIRKYLRKQGIMILAEVRNAKEISVQYLYRRYQHTDTYPMLGARQTVEELMQKYLGMEEKNET